MISCEKATTICNKAQYKEATFIEKLKLKYHLWICKTCAKHSKKNTQFTALCQKAQISSLSESDKAKMKEQLQQKQ